jgi:hypothetical protein
MSFSQRAPSRLIILRNSPAAGGAWAEKAPLHGLNRNVAIEAARQGKVNTAFLGDRKSRARAGLWMSDKLEVGTLAMLQAEPASVYE